MRLTYTQEKKPPRKLSPDRPGATRQGSSKRHHTEAPLCARRRLIAKCACHGASCRAETNAAAAPTAMSRSTDAQAMGAAAEGRGNRFTRPAGDAFCSSRRGSVLSTTQGGGFRPRKCPTAVSICGRKFSKFVLGGGCRGFPKIVFRVFFFWEDRQKNMTSGTEKNWFPSGGLDPPPVRGLTPAIWGKRTH